MNWRSVLIEAVVGAAKFAAAPLILAIISIWI